MVELSFQNPIMPARISLSGARAAYIGPGLHLSPHLNATATVAITLTSPFELEFLGALAPVTGTRTTNIAVIPPGTLHHLRSSGKMIFLYLDALSDDHAALGVANLAAAHARLTETGLDNFSALDVNGLCDALGVHSYRGVERRIEAVVRRLDERPQDFRSVNDAATMAGLSASRFQALFRRSLGMSFRRYRLWRRMAVVLRAISAGQALTSAAYEAGFASSAHLSTTFKEMFGLAPSELVALGATIELIDVA